MWPCKSAKDEKARIEALEGISDIHIPIAFQEEVQAKLQETKAMELKGF